VAAVDVILSKPFGQDVRVNYAVLGGTATPGADYLALNGTLFFLPGETNATLFVTLINDGAPEEDETVHVRLTSAAGASLGNRAEADVLVLDDDRAPRFVAPLLSDDQHFHAALRGAPGQKFRVEYSLDLNQWFPLFNATNTTGQMEFVDPSPAAPASRYYRTTLP
jgi:hypothetical protein